jgi:hypothetical protein
MNRENSSSPCVAGFAEQGAKAQKTAALSQSRKERQEQQECAAYGARHHQAVFRSLRSSRLGESIIRIQNSDIANPSQRAVQA